MKILVSGLFTFLISVTVVFADDLYSLEMKVYGATFNPENIVCADFSEKYQRERTRLRQALKNPANMDDEFVIEAAIIAEDLDLIQELIEEGIPLKVRKEWSSPLHLAAGLSSSEIIEFIVGLGVSVDTVDISGATPLFLAIGKNKMDNVKTLLRLGANINYRSNHETLPISASWGCKHKDIFDYLVLRGSEVDEQTKYLARKFGLL